jgi:iron uptake system component EfeO
MLACPALAAVLLLAGCGGATTGGAATGGAASSNVIEATTGECGGAWHLPGPGMHTFQIYNGASDGTDVYLVNPGTGAIFGMVEGLGPGTSDPMTVDVGSGTYAFECVTEDFDPIYGPTVTVPGNVQGTPGVLPVTSAEMVPPSKLYHAYVQAGLATLTGQVNVLDQDIKSGNLAAARRDWLSAHLTYERLGAAYGTFGNFDSEIDGRADGLPGGVNDPGFTGFYRLEYGLWHGQSAGQLAGPASTLDSDVQQLQAAWPAMENDLLDIGLRTHEILENALEFQLSGRDDYGSGTTLATTEANVQGTFELLGLLHSLLAPRYPQLPDVYSSLDQLQSLLLTEQLPNGQWVSLADLSTATREAIDAACDQALTVLAPIAVITEPRNVNE